MSKPNDVMAPYRDMTPEEKVALLRECASPGRITCIMPSDSDAARLERLRAVARMAEHDTSPGMTGLRAALDALQEGDL